MSLELILLRLLAPLFILRWPFFGMILAIFADNIDWMLTTFTTDADYNNYQRMDKLLDMYYLSLALYVSTNWKNVLAKHTSVLLFIYRSIGFILFEATQIRLLLFFFPNLFEFFYLFYQGYKSATDTYPKIAKHLTLILVPLLILKLIQEYSAHIVSLPPWEWPWVATWLASINANPAYGIGLVLIFLFCLALAFRRLKNIKS